MPLMVGLLADYYLAARVANSFNEAELFGFAGRAEIAEAELSPNGLFAILPLELLRPLAELPDALKEPSLLDPWRKRIFEDWQFRADRILVEVSEILSDDSGLDPEQIERQAANIWPRRVVAVRSNGATGAAPREPKYQQSRCRRISLRRSAQNRKL